MHIHPFLFYMHISLILDTVWNQFSKCIIVYHNTKVAENKDVLKIRILKKSTKGKMRPEELKTL